MGIVFNGGVINSGGTPQAITGVIADIPLAANVSEGTIFISTDTQEIFSAQAGSWINVSGGGGGSQNLEQVLTVGNNANGQKINLDNAGNTYIQYINGLDVLEISTAINTGGKQTNFSISSDPTSTTNQLAGNINAVASATSYDITNTEFSATINLTTVNTGYSSSVQIYSEATSGSGTYIRLNDNSGTFSNTVEINANSDGINECNIVFADQLTGFSQYLRKDLTVLTSSFSNALPEIGGQIATVNEIIRASGIVLTAGNFDCQVFGAYHVKTGSNTNDFDLTNFATNGNDGQFVTIMAEDTPIRCVNTTGTIFGTANINSKGLYKLMLFQGNIYSSHL